MGAAMNTIWRYLRTTLIGGLLFLLPAAIVVVVAQKAFGLLMKVLQPMVAALPGQLAIGSAAPYVTVILSLVIICFIAGLVARSAFGSRFSHGLEDMILGRLPGYTFIRSMFSGVAPVDTKVEVALVEMEEMLALAFVMERHANGYVTVFVPSAPTPHAGSVYFARAEHVRVIDMGLAEAMHIISKLGLGAGKALDKTLASGKRVDVQNPVAAH
jgi:uncharacterized membrane protein